jgi:hypothetical protein
MTCSRKRRPKLPELPDPDWSMPAGRELAYRTRCCALGGLEPKEKREVKWFQTGAATAALSLAMLTVHAQSPNTSRNGFTEVNAPGGGRYIYGPFTGKGSMSDAVLYLLRNIHEYFGNRPELGKFVQSRDGTQTAAFFAVNAKGAGDKPMTGLFIVARSGARRRGARHGGCLGTNFRRRSQRIDWFA